MRILSAGNVYVGVIGRVWVEGWRWENPGWGRITLQNVSGVVEQNLRCKQRMYSMAISNVEWS
jgi:hypothetical protein